MSSTIRTAGGSPAMVQVELRSNVSMVRIAARKGRRAALAQCFRSHFGFDLPERLCRTSNPHMAAIGVAPGAWLLLAEESPASLAASVKPQLIGEASLCDLTGAYVVMTLTGLEVRACLAKLVPIDLHPHSFQPNDAVQTLAHHISVILWRLEDAAGLPVFELAVPRSFFASLREALDLSAVEFGLSGSRHGELRAP